MSHGHIGSQSICSILILSSVLISFVQQISTSKILLVWTELERYIWSKDQSLHPKTTLEMTLQIYEACEVMSTEGTDMYKSLYNSFYGTFDEKYNQRR